MSVLIKHMAMPKGCIYANDKDQTEYCPLLNHDDVPFCQYIENEPEIAIGIDERPVYCPLSDVPEPCQDAVSRAATIDALDEIESEVADGYGYQYEKWRKYFCELPSIQPETHEKRTETHACDLISRQAAIDALMKRDKELRNINWYDKPFAEGECKGIDYALEIVNALPSVQPTQPNASNALKTLDCIDRQAAIDEAEEWIDAVYCEDGDQRERDAIRHVIHGIKELPAVQTEVPKCKDCYWWTKQSDSLQGRCDRYGFYPTGYWYCAAARERRPDE